jgi:hypothetical protein
VVAFTEDDWTECIRIADAIPTTGDFDRYRLDFLRGLSLFHLGSYRSSEEVFRRLSRESQDLSSRIVSKYLASDADGEARVYTGPVIWVWSRRQTRHCLGGPTRRRGTLHPASVLGF